MQGGIGFVRERKSFVDGDFARGRNQQRMISAIVKKVCSPAILTSFHKFWIQSVKVLKPICQVTK